ncbi:hypothetical protein RJ639_046765 [Escallonia herrerae]|uniref:Protein LURP-one-related 7 n=1 Tax=Escallonia herrerae TaxID=1293975 RepID=A0AA88W8J5_9ASTE|nr:hypothetical protein RJ639_046765 [Escallonia herrerae]
MDNTAAPEYPSNWQIPVDLFVSKKHKGLRLAGNLRFTDASGNLVFSVDRRSHQPAAPLFRHSRLLIDASGNSPISIRRNHNGPWQGFKGDNSGGKDLIFRVERTLNTFARTEFEVFLVNEKIEDSKYDFKIKGCPLQRSCTVYRGNSIVAQTSLMYKIGLRKPFVPRSRFRLTIFPEFVDHTLIVAFIVIYFDGRKLWI